MLLEAVPAVYRSAFRRLERDLAFLAAVRANRLVHLARAAEASAAESASAAAPIAASAVIATAFAVELVMAKEAGGCFVMYCTVMYCGPNLVMT